MLLWTRYVGGFETALTWYRTGGYDQKASVAATAVQSRVDAYDQLDLYAGWSGIEGLTLVVGDMMAQYKSEAFYGETMQVDMVPDDFNKYGFDLVFRLQDKASGREVARGKTGVVFVGPSADGGKKVSEVPNAFMARLSARQQPAH